MTAGRKKIEPSCGSFINNYMWGVRHLSSFLCCGDGGTRPASCSGPRRAFGHHGAERYGRRLLPLHIGLPSCTLHTVGGPVGRLFWLSATRFRSLCSQQTASPRGAILCDVHKTSVLKGPVRHNRGACTVPLVS
jgi:hypothetical protein